MMPSVLSRVDGRVRVLHPGVAAGVVVLLSLFGSGAAAQVPRLVAEVRVGVAVPSGPLAEDSSEGGAQAGPSLGAGFAFAVKGGLYVHAGFSQHRFGCDEGCADLGDLTATGFDLALRYAFVAGPVMPWIRAGTLPYTVEGSQTSEADGATLSDHTWGFEGGVGVNVPLSDNVHLSPGFRYMALDCPTALYRNARSKTPLFTASGMWTWSHQ